MLLFNDGKKYLAFNVNLKYLAHVRKYKKNPTVREPSRHSVYILIRKQVPVDKLARGTESWRVVPHRFIGVTVWGRIILLTDVMNNEVGLIISTFKSKLWKEWIEWSQAIISWAIAEFNLNKLQLKKLVEQFKFKIWSFSLVPIF